MSTSRRHDVWRVTVAVGLALLTAGVLTSCGGRGGGGVGPLPPEPTGRIADAPGMLGGELKPEAYPIVPAAVRPAAATPLTLGGAPVEGFVVQDGATWYEANLQAGHTYVVALQPLWADEDCDLYLRRPQAAGSEPLGNSRRGSGGDTVAAPDWVAFTAQESGLHQFAATGWSATTEGDPNDFRLDASEAGTLTVNGPAATGNLPEAGSRFYCFQATAGLTYTVSLNPTSGDADLFVYGDTSDTLQGSSTQTGADAVQFVAATTGTHLVRAYGVDAAAFDLTVTQGEAEAVRLFFLHHSTGGGFVWGGDMRGAVATYNATHATAFEFWDHGYNGEGLYDATGNATGTNYAIPNDNTDPDGLFYLWTSPNADAVAARDAILSRYPVIAFKSCFPASAIADAAMLQQYQDWYLAMRDVFDAHPDRLFVVMSTPPLHRLATNATEADNARAFANWLKSAAYLSGHGNIVCFDLFDRLAKADDASGTANMLRYEYEGSHHDSDSHPNDAANAVIGPALANFMCAQAESHHVAP